MTWTWSLPIHFPPTVSLQSPVFRPEYVRVIVPTFRDWDAARETVDSLMDCRPGPGEIVLVNDNHEPGFPGWVGQCPIYTVDYRGNRGPSHARNAGVWFNSVGPIAWLYFTDTGCLRGQSFFAELIEVSLAMPRTSVAIAAPVVGEVATRDVTPINHYMTVEEILYPPCDVEGPQAIVTANAAVSRSAFVAVGGFTTTYPLAAAEDVDLGVRLRSIGPIAWAPGAIVHHRFEESIDDFLRRFIRYGEGNAHLEYELGLSGGIGVETIVARDPSLQPLADIQVQAMQIGYDRHRVRLIELMDTATQRRQRTDPSSRVDASRVDAFSVSWRSPP